MGHSLLSTFYRAPWYGYKIISHKQRAQVPDFPPRPLLARPILSSAAMLWSGGRGGRAVCRHDPQRGRVARPRGPSAGSTRPDASFLKRAWRAHARESALGYSSGVIQSHAQLLQIPRRRSAGCASASCQTLSQPSAAASLWASQRCAREPQLRMDCRSDQLYGVSRRTWCDSMRAGAHGPHAPNALHYVSCSVYRAIVRDACAYVPPAAASAAIRVCANVLASAPWISLSATTPCMAVHRTVQS